MFQNIFSRRRKLFCHEHPNESRNECSMGEPANKRQLLIWFMQIESNKQSVCLKFSIASNRGYKLNYDKKFLLLFWKRKKFYL